MYARSFGIEGKDGVVLIARSTLHLDSFYTKFYAWPISSRKEIEKILESLARKFLSFFLYFFFQSACFHFPFYLASKWKEKQKSLCKDRQQSGRILFRTFPLDCYSEDSNDHARSIGSPAIEAEPPGRGKKFWSKKFSPTDIGSHIGKISSSFYFAALLNHLNGHLFNYCT